MNIFATDTCPRITAQQHCDRHVIKMILETAQLLSTAHVVATGKQVAYKKTHENHPCAIWVRASVQNYSWAYSLLVALLDEYAYRFGKVHKTTQHKKVLSEIPPLPSVGLTPHAQAMPEIFRSADFVQSYQSYMRAKLTEWFSREKPLTIKFTRRNIPAFLYGRIDAVIWCDALAA